METPPALLNGQAISSSLFFWWLAFLRCSQDYWWICQQQGECDDPRLVKVWEDFGDIYQYKCVMQWWNERGTRLFDSPQIEMDFIAPFESGLEVLMPEDLKTARPGMLCLAVPLFLDAQRACDFILEAWNTARLRGAHYISDAKYQLQNLDLKSKRTIIPAYQSWALNKCVSQIGQNERISRWGGYEMGMHIGLGSQNQPKPRDSLEVAKRKQRTVRALFCQSKKAASELIANVEVGVFPSKATVTRCPRWSQTQQKGMEQAIADGAWQQNGWFCKEHEFMLPERKTGVPRELPDSNSVITMLAGFNELKTPFLESKRKKKL
jgi:hypothetical protein